MAKTKSTAVTKTKTPRKRGAKSLKPTISSNLPPLLPPGPPPKKKTAVEALADALARMPVASRGGVSANDTTARATSIAVAASVAAISQVDREEEHRGVVPADTKPLVAAPSIDTPTWATAIEWVDPGTLLNHPLWHDLLGEDTPEREEELRTFVREQGVTTPLIVTGDGCASGREVILSGHRIRQAAMDVRVRLVPVIRRTDLDGAAEEELMIKSALASQHVRKLLPSHVARLEVRLFELLRGRHGGDRAVGSNGLPVGDTLDIVAAETANTRNSVADRRKVFSSPVSAPALQSAVDKGKISLTEAARVVREAEKGPGVAAALASDNPEHPALVAARDAVARNAGTQPKKKQKTKPHRGPITAELKLNDEGALVGAITLTGIRWTVAVSVQNKKVTMTRIGRAPKALDPEAEPELPDPHYIWPADPTATPITKSNWVAAIVHTVDELPAEAKASVVVVGEVEVLAPQTCTVCGGNIFGMRFGHCVRCVTCVPGRQRHVAGDGCEKAPPITFKTRDICRRATPFETVEPTHEWTPPLVCPHASGSARAGHCESIVETFSSNLSGERKRVTVTINHGASSEELHVVLWASAKHVYGPGGQSTTYRDVPCVRVGNWFPTYVGVRDPFHALTALTRDLRRDLISATEAVVPATVAIVGGAT